MEGRYLLLNEPECIAVNAWSSIRDDKIQPSLFKIFFLSSVSYFYCGAPAAVRLILVLIIIPRIIVHANKHKLTICGFVMLAVGFILLFLSPQIIRYFNPLYGSQSLLLLGITMSIVFILGVAVAVVDVPTQTMMIENTPEIGRARVFFLQFMLYNVGSIPILLFSALIAQFIGLNWIVFIISTSLLLFCTWGWLYVQHKS